MKVGLNTQTVTNPAFRALNEASDGINAQRSVSENTNLLKDLKNAEELNQLKQEVKQPTSVKDGIANVWKFFAVANKMANAALKGLFYGALTGVTLLSGSWLFKSLPKAFTKEGPTLVNTIVHPLKNIGKSGKIIAGVGSAMVLAYHLVSGKLDANQRTAVIDHKLKTGHRDK